MSEFPPLNWDALEWQTVVPGYRAKFIHSERMTFALWDIEPQVQLPLHNHPHEQVTYLLEGRFDLTVNETVNEMRPGDVMVIPPNHSHGGYPHTACKVLDIFSPRREDYASNNFAAIKAD